MTNPFELNFGEKPENYISRYKQSNEIIESFKNGNSKNVYMITGVRGSGKTVMLSSISNVFEKEKNWIVMELIPSYDMLDQFASALYDSSILHRLFNGKTFGFSFEGLSFSIKGDKPITNVITLLETLLSKISKAGKKVLICVDEVTNNNFVKPFVQAFQLLLRKHYPVYLLMTGLFENIYELKNDESLTFLYRAPKITLEPLNISAVANSYISLLGLKEECAIECAKLTKGYAYAYQVLGYVLFESGKKKIDRDVLAHVDQYLQEYAYIKCWYELSNNDKRFLLAFKKETESTQEILKITKFKKNTYSVYRDRLIKRGYINATSIGQLSLSLPRFIEFLKTV